jgi:hypothetical protein
MPGNLVMRYPHGLIKRARERELSYTIITLYRLAKVFTPCWYLKASLSEFFISYEEEIYRIPGWRLKTGYHRYIILFTEAVRDRTTPLRIEMGNPD